MPSQDVLDLNPDYAALLGGRATPARATYTARELQEQQALFAWIKTVLPMEPRLKWVAHVPNGGYRPKKTAVDLAAAGVSPGLCDILVFVPSRGYVSAAIELKVPGGTTSIAQVEWMLHLTSVGWHTSVAIGWTAAARELCWYLERNDLPIPE